MPTAVRRPRSAWPILLLLVALVLPSGPADAWPDPGGAAPPDVAGTGTPEVVAPGPPTGPGPRRADPLPVAPGGAAVRYVAPHPGGVVRGFDPPGERFGAGHRGVDLAASPGDQVTSAGAGVVRFAGEVADRTWVTVEHPDGVTTSYGPLTVLTVQVGSRVQPGTPIGRLAAGGHGRDGSDQGLHWGARRDGTYLDPLSLLGGGVPRPALVGPGWWRAVDHVVPPWRRWDGEITWLGTRLEGSPAASRPGYAVPPNWHHLVVIPGLNSEGSAPFDATMLGYGEADTTVFSYTGCDPTPTGCDPRSYQPEDTHHGLRRAAEDLADLLRALQRAQPNRPVDLVGHSQGGLIAAYLLEHLYDPNDPTLPPLANLVTYASPFGGSPLADLADSLSQNPVGHLVDGPARALDQVTDAGWPQTVRTTSPSIRDLQRSRGEQVLGLTDSPPIPTPTGVRSLHLAGKGDLVVRKGDAAPDGQPVSVLPGGHTRMAGSEAAHQQAYDFLAGQRLDPVDSWAFGAVGDLVGGLVEDLAFGIDVVNFGLGTGLPGGATLGPSAFGYSQLPRHDSQGRPVEP